MKKTKETWRIWGWSVAPILAATAVLAASGCARLRVEPVQVDVKPIHVTVDVNIKIQKVDKALENFFADVYGGPATNAPAQKEPDSKETAQ